MKTMLRLVSITGWLVLGACAAPPRPVTLSAEPKPAAPVPAPPVDPSYDWHGLILVPFGTALNKSGLALHEILEFHDTVQGADAARPGEADCFTLDPVPKFVGHETQAYALCFEHDRLTRIEAVVRLGPEEANEVFDHSCALWLKSGIPAAGTKDRCEGSEERVAFRARLDAGESAALLTMTLQAEPGGGPALSDP